MPRFITRLLAVVCLLVATSVGRAFSLAGPFATWMRQEIGYQIGGDLNGPMNLGEEYRWNQGAITYAYDSSFLDYFGSNGVVAVEAMMKILNAVPSTETMSAELTEFPLDTRRVNYTAQALLLVDLKSLALSAMLEQLGVAAAERWVFTLRERVPIGPVPIYFYTVIRRNFDPVTLVPSSYVNGALYTYSIEQTYANPDIFEAVEIAVDPNAPSTTSVASLIDGGRGTYDGAGLSSLQGTFFSGLTRDDVGSLRYLYRRQNYNVETLGGTPILASGTGVTGGGSSGGAGGGGGPWDSPFGSTGGGGDIWGPAVSGTITNAIGAGGTGGALTNFTRPVIDAALRPGVQKLNFVRVNYDSTLGIVLNIRNRFADTYITNGIAQTQFIELDTTQPDIIFSANDLGVTGGIPFPVRFNRTVNFVDQDAINGVETISGPGNIRGPVVLTFSHIGEWWVNQSTGSGEQNPFAAGSRWTWGFFDATTNAPIVFPTGASIMDLERAVLGR